MPQSVDKVLDHAPLFREPEYQEMFARKRAEFECPLPDDKIAEQGEYLKTWEYREKNLARESLVVNPAKACQPLGAVFALRRLLPLHELRARFAGLRRLLSFAPVASLQGAVLGRLLVDDRRRPRCSAASTT